MKKCTYSRTLETPEGLETFTAVEHDSFKEAQKAVDDGIYDRKMELVAKYPDVDFGYNKGDAIIDRTLPDSLQASLNGPEVLDK